jgi:hypothetical protein
VPELLIQLSKRSDGEVVLSCSRADGSKTWQRQRGRQASFFPIHDLTHYAVESELGFSSAFYGLIASGWDIEDTGGKGKRGPLPPEAVTVEHIVGSLDVERASGGAWSVEEFNEQAASFARNGGLPPPRQFSDAELARVRARARQLYGRWRELELGGTLELRFTVPD